MAEGIPPKVAAAQTFYEATVRRCDRSHLESGTVPVELTGEEVRTRTAALEVLRLYFAGDHGFGTVDTEDAAEAVASTEE